MRIKRFGRTTLGVCALALSLVAGATAAGFTPGSAGLGDPFFPFAGNGGYDVSNYSLTLDYTPSTNQLSGTAVIRATATQNLSRFDLDLRGSPSPASWSTVSRPPRPAGATRSS